MNEEKEEGQRGASETARYRENAAKARAAAEVTDDPAARELYWKVAASWQRLAEKQDWYENSVVTQLHANSSGRACATR